MTNLMIVGGSALVLAAAFFFFRMRAVAQQVDSQCTGMMNIALSLMVVIPLGMGVLTAGMFGYSKTGAALVAVAGVLSFSAGLVLIPVALHGGISRLSMTEEEKERDLFS